MSDTQSIENEYVNYSISNFDSKEKLVYISVPVQIGMRFELGIVTPYFYADIEPAVFTGGHQYGNYVPPEQDYLSEHRRQ